MEFATTERAVREEQRVTVKVDILGGDILSWGWRVARLWRPTQARVTYERARVNGEPWGAWVMLTSRVEGVNVRKDGSAGAGRMVKMYGRPRDTDDDASLATVWDHLAALRPPIDLDPTVIPTVPAGGKD